MRVVRMSLMALAMTAACSRAGIAETAVVGTGSAFAAPIYTKWAEQEKSSAGIAINYQPSGSSVGQLQVLKGLTDFGASDVPMDDRKLKEADILQFPTVVGGYAVVVNLPGVASGQLRLDGAVLADIFMGDIKLWDDSRIANLNPGISLPKLAISLLGAISVSRKSAVVFSMRASLPHTRHRWAVRRRITVPAMSEAVPSIRFNDHEPAFRLCLAAGYSGSGLGLTDLGPVRAAPPAAAATPSGAL